MIKFYCLALLVASVASSPIEILNYKDEEAGHGQVMSGTPGEAVMGEFHWKAPEGDAIRLVYTADMDGYVATGEHLPVSPDLTPEVMEARAAFMDKFDEAKAQAMEEEIMEDIAAVEIAEEIMEEKALGLRSDEPSERRRRDAEADAQVFMTQPLHYAPSYPYYFVQNGVELKQVEEESMENMDVPMKVEDMDEMKMTDLDSKKYTVPLNYYLPPGGVPQYAPSYYYPSLVQYPTGVKTTVTQRVSPWYQVSNVQYPFAYPGLVSQVGVLPPQPAEVPAERILPNEPQAGEEESAALLL